MAQIGFELLFNNLREVGFVVVLLLIFFISIYYGMIRKYELISDDETVDAAASLALGFITVFGILAVVPPAFFQQFFGILAVLLVLVLGLIIVMGLLGVDIQGVGEDSVGQPLAVIGVIILLLIVFPPFFESVFNINILGREQASFLLTLAMIVIFGAIIISVAGD